jgi:hypothetical protein
MKYNFSNLIKDWTCILYTFVIELVVLFVLYYIEVSGWTETKNKLANNSKFIGLLHREFEKHCFFVITVK